jgi:dTDP-4-amino-4,6-dideoxygalactose transaminase
MEIHNKLALFGNKPLFDTPRSTSNLIKPSYDNFINYIKPIYQKVKGLSGLDRVTIDLERRLADIHEVENCITTVNGLWGLVLSIYALKLKGKNEIIMPSLTYRRMADIAAWLDMVPHFCDVDENTLSTTPYYIEKCINFNTALILAPHPIVNLLDVEQIENLSKKYNIPLLFDSVEASHAEYKGKTIGSFGHAECFSMHASKFLNGFEGGYITTNDNELAEKLRELRNIGIVNDNKNIIKTGIDGTINELHAAMTLASIDEIEEQIKINKDKFLKYKEVLKSIPEVELVEYSLIERRSFKNILVKLNDNWPLERDITIKLFHAENMIVRPYYYPPLHKKENKFETICSDLVNTEKLKNKYLLLPCGKFLLENEIDKIANFFKFIRDNADKIKKALKEIE